MILELETVRYQIRILGTGDGRAEILMTNKDLVTGELSQASTKLLADDIRFYEEVSRDGRGYWGELDSPRKWSYLTAWKRTGICLQSFFVSWPIIDFKVKG